MELKLLIRQQLKNMMQSLRSVAMVQWVRSQVDCSIRKLLWLFCLQAPPMSGRSNRDSNLSVGSSGGPCVKTQLCSQTSNRNAWMLGCAITIHFYFGQALVWMRRPLIRSNRVRAFSNTWLSRIILQRLYGKPRSGMVWTYAFLRMGNWWRDIILLQSRPIFAIMWEVCR